MLILISVLMQRHLKMILSSLLTRRAVTILMTTYGILSIIIMLNPYHVWRKRVNILVRPYPLEICINREIVMRRHLSFRYEDNIWLNKVNFPILTWSTAYDLVTQPLFE